MASWTVLVLSFATVSLGQERQSGRSAGSVLLRLEDQVFEEINRLRADPADYAQRIVAPLKERLVRIPADPAKPFLEYRAFLVGGTPIDYYSLDEGGTEETAKLLLDETIEALEASPRLAPLARNEVLDRSARFYSRDFLKGGKKRDPHVDSLGRKSGPRIASFGCSPDALASWQRFVASLPDDSRTVARVFEQRGRYYWLAYSGKTSYRYWSISDALGKFVTEHGEPATLARLDKPGVECSVTVNRQTRTLHHGDAEIPYPFALPVYGENVTWGNWSQAMAARGMVCWWLLDPGIENRGHRKLLLDSDFRFAGVGCARSRSVGWVCTLDVCGEALVAYPETD